MEGAFGGPERTLAGFVGWTGGCPPSSGTVAQCTNPPARKQELGHPATLSRTAGAERLGVGRLGGLLKIANATATADQRRPTAFPGSGVARHGGIQQEPKSVNRPRPVLGRASMARFHVECRPPETRDHL